MVRLATICARGGSKGVPNKNIREILGHPLIAHTIRQIQRADIFDFIAVSSDSREILDIALKYGVKDVVLRPEEFATDDSSKTPAVVHCIKSIESKYNIRFNTVVDLDATSPLRKIEDIHNAVNMCESLGISNVLTACEARRSPYFNMLEKTVAGQVVLSKPPVKPIVRRQDAPRCFDMNASIYVWKRDKYIASPGIFYPDTGLYEMPQERSIDIDSPTDFEFVEFMMQKRLNEYE